MSLEKFALPFFPQFSLVDDRKSRLFCAEFVQNSCRIHAEFTRQVLKGCAYGKDFPEVPQPSATNH